MGGSGIWGIAPAPAQNLFGEAQRAAAAQQAVVVAVQQGISSLPPTSGQAFSYQLDEELGTYVPSEVLGPISFRTPQTVGRNNLTFRFAASYFDLGDTFGPILYEVNGIGEAPLYTMFGTKVDAQVGLFNLAVNYGVLDRLELTMNLPIAVTSTNGDELYLGSGPNSPDPTSTAVRARDSEDAIDRGLNDKSLAIRSLNYDARGVGDEFSEGTHAGVGRISLGGKGILYSGSRFQAAFMTELFLPSPSEAEFAGSDTLAILPRVVTQTDITEMIRMHVDAGYDYDFSDAELRRFTWNVGGSLALKVVTFDAGVGGSLFDEGIEWTPSRIVVPGGSGITLTALGDNRLGNNYVDFLGGVKFRLAERWVLGGAVNVPINDEGFRADAVGTVALEVRL